MINNELHHEDDFLNNRKDENESPKFKKGKNTFLRPRKIKRNNREQAGENPFKSDWEFPVSQSFDRYQIDTIDKNGDQRLSSRTIYKTSAEDIERIINNDFQPHLIETGYIRLFTNSGLKNLKLKHTTNTLLLYILLRLPYGSDLILINKQEIVDKKSILSKDTFYNALNELLMNNVIAKSNDVNHYWVNISFFFHGSRPTYFQDYVYDPNKGDRSEYNDMKKRFRDKVLALKAREQANI